MTELTIDPLLTEMLNFFPVPMFAIERLSSGRDFHLVSVNRALEKAARCKAAHVLGKSLFDLLPTPEARRARVQFALCADRRTVIRFQDRFTLRDRCMLWDTTLQYAQPHPDRDRVLGTCIQLTTPVSPTPMAPAFEDIRYVSSMAEFQLQNLIATFDANPSSNLFNSQNTQRIATISSICRSIQRAVVDIKAIAQKAEAMHETHQTIAMPVHAGQSVKSGMVRALIASSLEHQSENDQRLN